ncbi:glycosyl hydrolase family 28-related protein [Lactiplantibacillus plantarum]|uniref:glycosyl hydrolase family 28-related protein n=1 Tax=Lactiplantibacillus plantarum TaxID=1590 RepID=UPI00402B5A2C
MISTITLDTYKQQIGSGDAFNLSDSFNGRVGDEQVPLVVQFKERGIAQRFEDGLVPFLTGFVGSLDENDQVTADTGEAVSYVGTSNDIVGLGRVKMNLPGTMFPQEGYFYGFLGLRNADGKRVTTFNVWFHIYNGNPDMFVNKAPFRTELQKLLDAVQLLIDDADGDLNKWKQKLTDLFTALSAQGADTATLLTTLQVQIKQSNLFTQGQMDELLGSLTSFKPMGSNLIDKLNNEFSDRGVNVKWFGAKGDGVADDSDAIQAAVDTGSSVFVPAGTYLITKTISLNLQNFIGAGANQTIFNVQNTDLFELAIGGRTIAEIAYFRVESKDNHADSNTVFKSQENDTKRAIAYHFHDIEINGGRFKYAFNLTDSFRTTINKIGMTNVFNPFLLRGQVVQTTIDDVTCNIDTVELGALNDYNTGIEVVGDSHSGSYQRPESVRLSNVNFVGYDLGYNIKDVLYFVSDKFECDYCANGIRTFSTDGGVTFTNGWIAVQNRRDTPSVGIDVLPSIQNALKPVAFDNISISGIAGLNAASVAVRVGYDESQASWFKQGVTAQNLLISAANSAFKYAVQANRAKTLTLDGIRVATDTAQMDFYLVNCESYSLKNLNGQTASIATNNADNSILENCNIPNLKIVGAYPQYYNNDGVLKATNRSIEITSTDNAANYTNNLSVNSGNLWVDSSHLMYKFGKPTNNTDGSRVIRVADVTSLPNPDASVRGDIYTLKGTTDKVYICVYQTNEFVWKQLI